MKALLKRFWKEEEGLELVEYAVMTALLVAVLIVGIKALGTAIDTRFDGVETEIGKAGAP
jgi:Flp pilus assembly pilin Flp